MKRVWTGLILCLALLLTCSFAACSSQENEAVKNVSALIGGIGAVSEITLDSKDEIEAARTAYGALSDEDKESVFNYADLQAAEEELSVLQDIDALTPTITSAASMKSGEKYTPSLSGYEYADTQAQIAWTVTEIGSTGASVSDGVVTAQGIGRFTLVATVSYTGHNIRKQAAMTVEVGGYTVSGPVQFPAENGDLAAAVERAAQGVLPLAYGMEGSYSLKYNLLFDKLLGFGLIGQEVLEREKEEYCRRGARYGVPLDVRARYTKSDWILWCAALTDDADKRQALYAPVLRYLRESPSRYPFGDWYDADSGAIENFINRTVQGGIFAPLLREAFGKGAR